MQTLKSGRLYGLLALALTVFVGLGTVAVPNMAYAQPTSSLEQFDAMGLTAMPADVAKAERGEAVQGMTSFWSSLVSTGACYKVGGPRAGVICGVGFAFAQLAWDNKYNIMYLLAYQGGRYAKVTTPCMLVNGVRYYCM